MLKRGDGNWLVPEPLRSKGTAAQIVASVDWHHIHPVALGGANNPQNIVPLDPAYHNVITEKIDQPRIAKAKRLLKKEEEFRRTLLVKTGQADAPPPKHHSKKLSSLEWKRKVNGKTVPRIPRKDFSGEGKF